ncbi:hypothetical protein [Pararobbsia silviterrae]|uniref:hypothetical protein n=1 Tax=Pararobbsia silviterrae TaxID=1792498 RepID=UPI0011C3EA18|nr:hypothetical protein [Pararobbsia silviterrae]
MTDEDIAREFRELRCVGDIVDALASPGLRLALRNCAEIRKQRASSTPPKPAHVDLKRLASGDSD